MGVALRGIIRTDFQEQKGQSSDKTRLPCDRLSLAKSLAAVLVPLSAAQFGD